MNFQYLLDRKELLFHDDLLEKNHILSKMIEESRFLVIGGAGTIGQSVVIEILKRKPKVLHVVDLSENNLVELVREIRSTLDYEIGDFQTFAIDSNSIEFDRMIERLGPYDYIFNLSALKHVRSEKDPYTLMRMAQVNIFNTIKLLDISEKIGVKKYFSVSTDKAANPVNMMGTSKKIMEMFMMNKSQSIDVSLARFANVAFSDGSLLHGFNQRFAKRHQLVLKITQYHKH
ncbi:polysaccharide biosynthesis protein [Amylibacter sp.]|nr:polysaccharide biosynthesis protein [Amylibacter sp.]